MSSDPVVAAHELVITSRLGGRERLLVDGISLELRRGEAVAIVGESGSGKSMTALALTGLLPPGVRARGSIVIDGVEMAGASERRWRSVRGSRIGLLPQDPFTMLSPLRGAGDQVRDGARSRISDDELQGRLAEVGVRDPAVARRYPFELSGGLRQRIGLAAALACDPDVLIADEPSTALDVTTQRQVLSLLTRLRQARGLALLLITHDLRVAFAVCDRILILYAGTLLEAGPSAALEQTPQHPYTRGLLASEPAIDRWLAHLAGIPGAVPRPDDVASRCAFADRCDWAASICTASRPALRPRGAGHLSACVRIEQIADELRTPSDNGGGDPPPTEEAPVLLRVAGISKRFSGTRRGTGAVALEDVALELRDGEAVGLVGESGSGKTTLARVVAGLERPDAGEVLLDGEPIRGGDGPHPVQVVFQDPASTLNPARRVGSMLRDALRAAGRPAGSEEVATLLDEVSLPAELAVRKPGALSGGERQRVAIARAIATRPRLLLCDEPVSALDVSAQAQILELFRELRRRHRIALMFISHDLAVVRQISERIYVLYRGRVVEHGTTASVLARPEHPYTRELIASVPRSDGTYLAPPTMALA